MGAVFAAEGVMVGGVMATGAELLPPPPPQADKANMEIERKASCVLIISRALHFDMSFTSWEKMKK